jgi:hypothetical protein
MPRHPHAVAALAAAFLAVPMLVAGCSQASDAAKSAASDAASKAADTVQDQAKQQAIRQVCGLTEGSGPLADGKVSDNEKAVVASIASVAEKAGVPAEYTEPAKRIASSDAGDEAAAKGIAELKAACAGQ